MDEVSRMSLVPIIGAFILYIILHVCIGIIKKNIEKDLEKNPKDVQLTKNLKTLTLLFNWFPAIYVVIVIIIMYI